MSTKRTFFFLGIVVIGILILIGIQALAFIPNSQGLPINAGVVRVTDGNRIIPAQTQSGSYHNRFEYMMGLLDRGYTLEQAWLRADYTFDIGEMVERGTLTAEQEAREAQFQADWARAGGEGD